MIQFIDFSKGYSNKNIIGKSNFEISENKISFLMGPNGSGKTTLIKCMMNMENYQGKIIFDGRSVKFMKNRCLVLWDDCPFYTNLSGMKNLIIFNENKKSNKQIIEIASKYIGYELLKTQVKKYSYGQKKKLALVLVEILEPKYLIMDEISNGLDYEMMKILKGYIRNWSNKMTILLTGHQFNFYNELVDSLYIFKNKKIVLFEGNFDGTNVKLEDVYDDEVH
jgi:ABC-type multidrug transport system ATPase subunit